jgi:hypothetical protein
MLFKTVKKVEALLTINLFYFSILIFSISSQLSHGNNKNLFFPRFFLPYNGVAEVLRPRGTREQPSTFAGRGVSETRLGAAPTRGNPRNEVPPA